MKILFAFILALTCFSCAVKVPLTSQIKEEYGLNAENMKKVQFFVSSEIIIEKSSTKGSSGTTSDGTLVSQNNKEQSRIIIMPRTKCVFEKYGPNNEVFIRFEPGNGKIIRFSTRPNMEKGKFYLDAQWEAGKGGKLEYDNAEYYATPGSGDAYLMVKVKKSQRTKRKDRIVKGMKV